MNAKRIFSANFVQLLLGIVGVGVVGGAAGTAQASNDIFARQFLNKGAAMTIPKMVYCPKNPGDGGPAHPPAHLREEQ